MQFLLFAIVAFIAVAHVVAGTNPVITYQDIVNGVNFKSEGDVPNTSNYYYLGGFFNLNMTAKVYVEATIDPACASKSTASITVYSDPVPGTKPYSYTIPSQVEFHSVGSYLSGANEYPALAATTVNSRAFFALAGSCTYHVTARSETK